MFENTISNAKAKMAPHATIVPMRAARRVALLLPSFEPMRGRITARKTRLNLKETETQACLSLYDGESMGRSGFQSASMTPTTFASQLFWFVHSRFII